MIRKRLGDALVDSGLINADQLKQALAAQKELGKRLGKVLVELNFSTDEQISQALAGQLGIKYLQLDEMLIEPDVIRLIPETIVRSHILVPVSRDKKTLLVAMADPLDAFIVDEIRYQTNLEVEEAIASEASIQNAIHRYFGAKDVSQALLTIKSENLSEIIAEEDNKAFDLTATDEAAVVNFVSTLIRQAISEKASDIHLEPEEDALRVRFRVDGVLAEIVKAPKAR
ncbi:MAG: type II secretion system protein GspE, partial [Candidatus Riflebacteria bacterium]|nr:type II secretion system protein GspE [Candidatus Riflebacteria bacterium]